MSKFILSLFGCLACTAVLANAQAAPEPTLRTDLMPVTLGGKIDTYFVSNGEVKPLEAYSSAMAPPIFYKGPAKLRLYATEADARNSIVPPKTGAPKPIATVNLPAGVRRTLLFQMQNAKKELEVRAIGVDDSALRGGDFRVFNMSTLNLLGIMGKNSFRIAPGQTADIAASSLGSNNSDLTVKFGAQAANRQDLVYSSVWAHSSSSRTYIFLVGTGNPKKPVAVKKFFDVPSAESVGYQKEE
jgi:hypothetical protein